MSVLSSFPLPPPRGKTTLYEYESQLIVGPPDTDVRKFTDQISNYPNIHISGTTFKTPVSRESAKSAFIQHTESLWKKAVIAWHEQGLIGALRELSHSHEDRKIIKLARFGAQLALKLLHYAQSLHGSFFPHLLLSHEAMCDEFSMALDWNLGVVKAFSWHPQTVKCAVALHDDTIRIYMSNNQMIPILKYRFQKGVTDMAWKPYSASFLAVGCQNGLLLWNIDPSSLVSRPSSSCVRTLRHPGHAPVTSVEWHPTGCLLVSASAADRTMIVWDVSMETGVPLQRVGGGGVALLRWSPDGSRLFAATPSAMFRVWETFTWTCERFTNLVGRCQASCWSSDGSILLFATQGEPIVYSLGFSSSSLISPHFVGGSKSAIPLIDLTQTTVTIGDEEIRVGGRIQMLAWDKTSERLAVSFKDNAELIAVFRTRVKPVLEVTPCGFVRGLPGESAQLIAFHNAFESGALLTICWSSGRISHIPFLFFPIGTPVANGALSQLSAATSPVIHRQMVLQNQQNALYST